MTEYAALCEGLGFLFGVDLGEGVEECVVFFEGVLGEGVVLVFGLHALMIILSINTYDC